MHKACRLLATGLFAALALSGLPMPAEGASCLPTGPCARQIQSDSRFREKIRKTARHCDGPMATCTSPPTDQVFYSRPVTRPDDEGGSHETLDALLEGVEAIFTLPFVDTRVKRTSGWLYGPGWWHHAVDYTRLDGQIFPVRSAAPGTVIFAEWDSSLGNTVIVSHDAGGVTDAYRTIYGHLRNGPDNDCRRSWEVSVDTVAKGAKRDRYKAHLLHSGCPEASGQRRPRPAFWGTEAHRLPDNLAGRAVERGEHLGWAGATGPGGQRDATPPNTHLHIYFARKQASDGRWYFFDPYGIYGLPHCYPQGITERPSGPCVRLPVAWQDGRPQYPGTAPGCGNGPACPSGLTCTNGLCVPQCTMRCPGARGCYRDPAANNACHRNESYTEARSCATPMGQCIWPCTRRPDNSCRNDVAATRKVNCPLECIP